MRLKNYLIEMSASKKNGITFIDIDETIYHTFAQIYVIKNNKIIKKLNNQEFNTYKLKDGESYDFREFKDAKLFAETSISIKPMINRIKKMLKSIDDKGKESKIVFLTARSDFDKKHRFLSKFEDDGINIDKIYVERTGNMKTGTVAERKKSVVLKYLSSGKYLKCRLIDDDITNLKEFKKVQNKIPESTYDDIRKYYKDDSLEPNDLEFYALLMQSNGKLKLIK